MGLFRDLEIRTLRPSRWPSMGRGPRNERRHRHDDNVQHRRLIVFCEVTKQFHRSGLTHFPHKLKQSTPRSTSCAAPAHAVGVIGRSHRLRLNFEHLTPTRRGSGAADDRYDCPIGAVGGDPTHRAGGSIKGDSRVGRPMETSSPEIVRKQKENIILEVCGGSPDVIIRLEGQRRHLHPITIGYW
ncbi:hypothetical protein EVAR_9919_1 [Eumeta japonica]|uniref:Uncharacterized protein n=1 Tax=Eumeta variegata TaxID=151549 RepID=A0A4C1TQH8_EUMVA|nr:hypothetical protein EVAR_9919_1 [Eumeta japonica]